jgi:hypothetical protein
MSNSKFGSTKEYWGYYYENRWVLRDVPDISESNDKKEQTHYNEFLEKNTKKLVNVHSSYTILLMK